MSPHLTTPAAYMHEGMNRAADTSPPQKPACASWGPPHYTWSAAVARRQYRVTPGRLNDASYTKGEGNRMSPHLTTRAAYMHEGINRAADTNPHRNLHVPHGDHPTILGPPLWHEDHA